MAYSSPGLIGRDILDILDEKGGELLVDFLLKEVSSWSSITLFVEGFQTLFPTSGRSESSVGISSKDLGMSNNAQ